MACRGTVQYAQPLTSSAPASYTLVGSGGEGAGAGAGVEPWSPGSCAGAGRCPAGENTAGPGVRVPGSAVMTPQSRSVPRFGVHSADINGPGVSAPSGDRWNAAVRLWSAASERSLFNGLCKPLWKD